MIVCLSPNGGASSSSDEPIQDLVVGTVGGVHSFQRDAAGELRPTFTSIENIHVGALAYEPASHLLFAAGYGDGLFVSDDGGRTFSPCMNGITNDEEYLSVFSLAVQPRGNGVVALYAGIEPAGLFRSFDLGKTWTELPGIKSVPHYKLWSFPPPPHRAHVKCIGFDPSEPRTLYVAVEVGALLKSTDDGATWQELSSYNTPEDPSNFDSHRVVVSEKDPNRVYLTGGPGIYTTTDAGETWIHRTKRGTRVGYPDAFVIDPDDENTLYVAGASVNPPKWPEMNGSTNPGVLRSTDGGATWSEWMDGLPDPLSGNIEAMSMHASPGSVEMILGTTAGELYYSEKRGEHWSLLASGLPALSKVGHHLAISGRWH